MSEPEPQREPDQLEGVLLPEQQAAVVGHAQVRATLTELIAGGRVPGAILLHGPQGIGKATLAFGLARDILVATGDEEPHRVAEQVAAGGHPNVFVLRRTLNKTRTNFQTGILVDQIATRTGGDSHPLKARLQQTRGRAGYRVAIVDSIDDCNANAANALLKILEEPPPETVFLLISHRPQSLLPTIRSRCQTLAMRPLSDADVRAVLVEQRPDVAADRLEHAMLLAAGRPRRGFEALGLADASAVGALRGWLAGPMDAPPDAHLTLADGLAAAKGSASAEFARDMLREWIAGEARAAAVTGAGRARLASANDLWEKANASFADADEYNLDARQTLIEILDAIRRHLQHTSASPEPR